MPDTLEITGVYIGKGVECPQFRLPDGEQISLDGPGFDRPPVGSALTLTGRFVNISTCMQGRTFLVSASAPAVSAP